MNVAKCMWFIFTLGALADVIFNHGENAMMYFVAAAIWGAAAHIKD